MCFVLKITRKEFSAYHEDTFWPRDNPLVRKIGENSSTYGVRPFYARRLLSLAFSVYCIPLSEQHTRRFSSWRKNYQKLFCLYAVFIRKTAAVQVVDRQSICFLWWNNRYSWSGFGLVYEHVNQKHDICIGTNTQILFLFFNHTLIRGTFVNFPYRTSPGNRIVMNVSIRPRPKETPCDRRWRAKRDANNSTAISFKCKYKGREGWRR